MKGLDLKGQTFNRLFVIRKALSINGRSAWECRCSCGTVKVIKTENLRDGSTKSCGCLNNDQRSARAKAMYSVNIKYTPRISTARRVWRGNYEEMPFEDFYELSQQNCFYCDLKPSNCQNSAEQDKKSSQNARDEGDFIYSGLDRIDSNLPHTKQNCVPACKECNLKKSDDDVFDFALWVVRIYRYWAKKYDSRACSCCFTDDSIVNDYLW